MRDFKLCVPHNFAVQGTVQAGLHLNVGRRAGTSVPETDAPTVTAPTAPTGLFL